MAIGGGIVTYLPSRDAQLRQSERDDAERSNTNYSNPYNTEEWEDEGE